MNSVYMRHFPSGEVFAINFENDELVGICGPLHYSEVTKENLKANNFEFEYKDNFNPANLIMIEPNYITEEGEDSEPETECSI